MLKRLLILLILFSLGTVLFTNYNSPIVKSYEHYFNPGGSYLGRWIGTDDKIIGGDKTHIMEIIKDGRPGSFLVKDLMFSGMQQGDEKINTSATLTKNGLLEINELGTITYKEKDDSLHWNGITFKRYK